MHIITTHENADFDGLASMIAAYKFSPEAILIFPGSKEEYLREFITQTLAYDYDFQELQAIDLRHVTQLTIVDSQSSAELGSVAGCLENPDVRINIFDHHPDTHGDLSDKTAHIENYGACTTYFVRIIKEKNLVISPKEATIFALGIYGDTDSLTHLDTTPEDIYAAGWLLEQGADLGVISHFLRSALGTAQEEILHELKQAADIFYIQRFPITIASLTLPHYVNDLSLIVKHYCEMENLDSVFVLIATENRIQLTAQSRIADINVGVIARDMGGGGHATSASATLTHTNMTEAEEQLIDLLHLHIQPQPLASEMMSSPVISISPNISLQEANATLTRYNITALPVMDDTKDIVGIISRQIVEKAMYHDLGHLPVNTYMSTEVETLDKNAPLAEVQTLIIEHRQRLIPIRDEQTIIGIVTRTDLLNRLVNDPANLPKDLHQETALPSLKRKRNLNSLMVETLDRKMILLLRDIGEIADGIGFNAFAVGGFVRDLLQNSANKDLDIVVEGNGIAFAKLLTQKMGGKYLAHEKYMTAIITLPDGFKVDIATARLEYYEAPASLPMVELSSIKLDLSRRDFSINAMALQINAEYFGTLIDYFNCQNDLKQKKIKVLHNLSFVEDPSRIFRAVRFESRMKFKIADHTIRLIKNAIAMNLFGKSRDSRFLSELKYILLEKDPLPSLLRLAEFKIFQYLWPDLRPSYRINRRFTHTISQTRNTIEQFEKVAPKEKFNKWMIYLLAIFHSSGTEELNAFCLRFKEDEKHQRTLLKTKYQADALLKKIIHTGTMPTSVFATLLADTSNDVILYMISIARTTALRTSLFDYITNLRDLKPILTGKDLMILGFRPGPQFKEILTALRFGHMDNILADREEELAFVKENFTAANLQS